MTHSLEVMQLATSMARTLGLNPILCEAIALAHDVGHTPFGHAGEEALDDALRLIKFEGLDPDVKGLQRFSHYEQGLDVVSYIDSMDPSQEASGLHLDDRICEGILKHTYDHEGDPNKSRSLQFLLAQTKYPDIPTGSGSLEAQVVRVCDKISYFISDIEDGLIIGALHLGQLRPWRDNLFDVLFSGGALGQDTEHDRVFRNARDKILTKVVESVLRQSAGNLTNAAGTGLVITPEPDTLKALSDVYHKVQRRMFEENILVTRANRRARHIVSCLFCQYLRHPELIPWRFRQGYGESGESAHYDRLKEIYTRSGSGDLEAAVTCNLQAWFQDRRERLSEANCSLQNPRRSVGDIICVKDYVSGMTDNFAEVRYKGDVECPQSRQIWKDAQMDRARFFNIATVR